MMGCQLHCQLWWTKLSPTTTANFADLDITPSRLSAAVLEVKERVKSELDRRLGFVDFARIHFISALHGTGVGHLYESVQEAYQSATKRISTSMLTRIMQMLRMITSRRWYVVVE